MRSLAPLLFLCAAALAQEEYGPTHRIKVAVGGKNRKAGLFIPNVIKKGQTVPMLVVVPDHRGKAFLEIGQWQQMAHDNRFAVFSVDCTTSSNKTPWHHSEQLDMQRDMEAVVEGLKAAREKAAEQGIELDGSATVISGFSGGGFLTMWLGLRRPDLFMGICGRSIVYFKETVKFSKADSVKPNLAMPILLYRGELDLARPKKDTDAARKTLKAVGYTNVAYRVIPKMIHESKPDVCVKWFVDLLKKTAKGRKEARKIAAELDKLRPLIKAGKSGVFGKLVKIVEREQKAGVNAGAQTLLDETLASAKKHWDMAANLEADNELAEAATMFRQIEKKYKPLGIAKEARAHRAKLIKSDAYKAAEMLVKARSYLDKDKKEKAFDLLQRIVDKYPDTIAGETAQRLLDAG